MKTTAFISLSSLTLFLTGSVAMAASPAMPRRMAIPATVNRVVEQTLPTQPTELQLRQFQAFSEPLIPVETGNDPRERKVLAAALTTWAKRTNSEDHSALRAFVISNPFSRWTPSLQLNLGLLSYEEGRFSQALIDWGSAWEAAKGSVTNDGKSVANAALAQYCKMLSRLGRKQELATMLEAITGRQVQGAALEHFTAARESLSAMQNQPGRAYRCGPAALASIQQRISGKTDFALFHELESPEGGFSMAQVAGLAKKADLKMVAARRAPGAVLLVPSVVHWKLDHFGALLEERNGRYLLKDPTFGSEHWVTREALDEEASGAFLVFAPSDGLPDGWQPLSGGEARSIHGKGLTGRVDDTVGGGSNNSSATGGGGGGDGGGDGGGGSCGGMARYFLQHIPCSVLIQDSPISYNPAFGPFVNFRISYNQRQSDQPISLLFSNFGSLWSGEFMSYLEDDPADPASVVTIHLRNGGYVKASYNTQSSQFLKDPTSDALLVRINSNVYERRFRDGSKEVYGQAIGTTGPNRKVFLTAIVDANGRTLSLVYDTNASYPSRLKFLVDASGLATELFYDQAGYPYLITKVRDPFGREARFFYAELFGQQRLQKVRDVIGLESSFGYDANGRINAMTTPYGTTNFAYSTYNDFPAFPAEVRFVEVTDPTGQKERSEYRTWDAKNVVKIFDRVTWDTIYGTPESDPVSLVPSGLSLTNAFLYYRNVFYWDKKAMSALVGSVTADPTAAGANVTIYHYLHVNNATTAGILESVKRPLESRVWYNYPDQVEGGLYVGSSAVWSAEARVIEDGNGGTATEITRRTVNAQGQVTKVVDPIGRETVYDRDANGIDLRFTKQKVGGSYQTIQEIQYNPAFRPHLPWKITDAAGQTTTYAYNSRAQVTSITNALNETTTFAYEENTGAADFAKLKSIAGALPGATTSFTYDVAQRTRTVTDSAGYTLTYDYDNLDRPTRVTYPDGTYEETGYDRLDVSTRRDREGRITQTKYNANRELVMSIDPAQRVTQFDYCTCGTMETLIDGNGNRTKWDFDVQGRQISKRYADGKGDDFAYEPLSGRLSSIKDAKGQVTKFTYNLDGTLRKLDYQNEQIATPDVTYTYDPNFNRLATMVDGIGTHTYGYYPTGVLGALQLHTLDGPFTDPVPLTDLITYTYDELGRVKTRNIGPTGSENKITWGYDALGRSVSEINNLCASGSQFTHNYVGTTGRLASVIYPNGQNTVYDYWPAATSGQPGNGDFRLKQIANYGQGTDTGTLLSRFDYTYDSAGNITTWGRKLGAAAIEQTYTLGYDGADQLTRGVLSETANPNNLLYRYYATFDNAGNRLSKQEDNGLTSYAYNNLNELTSSEGGGQLVAIGHTDEAAEVTINGVNGKLLAGNIFGATVPVTAGVNQLSLTATDFAQPPNSSTKRWNVDVGNAAPAALSYDFNGNATTSPSGSFTWNAANQLVDVDGPQSGNSYLFDGMGRRVAEFSSSGQIINTWIWCEMEICEERTSSEVVRKYQQGAMKSGTIVFFTFDQLGSLREGASNTGALLRRWDFSLNGERQELANNGGFEVPFGFTGHYQDSDQFISAPFRTYSTTTGKWLSRDPINEADGPNLYSYVRNRPTQATDLLGLKAWICKQKDWWQPHAWYCVTDATGAKRCFDHYPSGNPVASPGTDTGRHYSRTECYEIPTTLVQDQCLTRIGEGLRPTYGGGATNCTRWRNSTLRQCGLTLSPGWQTPSQ